MSLSSVIRFYEVILNIPDWAHQSPRRAFAALALRRRIRRFAGGYTWNISRELPGEIFRIWHSTEVSTWRINISYTKELDMIKYLIIKGEVVAGDDIEASVLL